MVAKAYSRYIDASRYCALGRAYHAAATRALIDADKLLISDATQRPRAAPAKIGTYRLLAVQAPLILVILSPKTTYWPEAQPFALNPEDQMRKVLASLGAIALAGCAVPPPSSPQPTPLLSSVPSTIDTVGSVSITDFTWRLDGTLARGTFTLTNKGPQPVDRVLIVCDVYGVRAKSAVGWLAANI